MTTNKGFKALLLDIEGTTTPISFVTDVLFPYAKAQYATYIRKNWNEAFFSTYKEAFTAESKTLTSGPEALIDFVEQKHASNEKHTAFKSLQGALWKSGYEDGSIKSIVYADVPRKITQLERQGVKTYIYSSGSVPAQKLLFQYSDQGDMTPSLCGYFDTSTAGPKTVATSYTTISQSTGLDSEDVLFLSDNVKEVKAAKEAGMQSRVIYRPGNADLAMKDRKEFGVIGSFDEI